jgi:capsular polysaccharide biosynthesis protein
VDGLTPPRVTGRGSRLPMVAGYFATLRSHLGAVVALALVGMLAGGFLAHLKQPEFKASTFILLPDVPTYVDLSPEPPAPGRTTIDTTSMLVFSTPVYEAVSNATGIAEAKVADDLSVSAYPLSRVLIVTFTARTKDEAIAGANEAADAVSAERASLLPGAQTTQAEELAQKLSRLLDRSRERVRPFSPQTQELNNQRLQVEDAIDAGQTADGRVVNRADSLSVRRVKQHSELQVVTGMMIGLLVGIGYAWWRRDKHLHHDPRIIGLAAKVRPRWRIGRQSQPPGRGPRRRRHRSHAG